MWRIAVTASGLSALVMAAAMAEPAAPRADVDPPMSATAGGAPAPAAAVPRETLSVVIAGDLGFGGSDQPVSERGAVRHGQIIPFAEMFRQVAPWLAADVVFANLETVVTSRQDLRAVDKAFNFRSHPAGLRYLAGLGLNAVSLANNHAIDYGETGLRETLAAMALLRGQGIEAAPGVGIGRAGALAPGAVRRGSATVQIGALGIGAGGFGDGGASRAGMAAYPADLADTAAALATAAGDLRLLSVHFNQEMAVRPSPEDARRLREVVQRHGIDLVAGHHAHVVAGVQSVGEALIFYGLGNFAHPGMQDMGRYGVCRDYGLLARIHYSRAPGERFSVRAIEVVTLDDMHAGPRPRTGSDGAARIAVLNHLAEGLDHGEGARGVRFRPRADGTGLYCAEGAADEGGRIGALCRAAPDVVERAMVQRAAASCGGELVARRRDGTGERRSATAASSAPTLPSTAAFRAAVFKGAEW